MGIIFILVLMIFMHIVDDYYLQGWLASAKQKKWWNENAPQKLYRHDYIMALIMHSLSWAFMIMLPIAIDRQFAVTWIYAAYSRPKHTHYADSNNLYRVLAYKIMQQNRPCFRARSFLCQRQIITHKADFITLGVFY